GLAIAEAIDAAVFEEPPDHRFNPDIVRKTGNARPQAADAAHDQVDLHARLAGIVERIDDVWIDQRIHLEQDAGRLAFAGEFDLGRDIVQQRLAQVDRRDRNGFELGGPRIAGDEVEYARHVAGNRWIDGEVAEVRIDLSGDRVVVAGADMAIADHIPLLAPP